MLWTQSDFLHELATEHNRCSTELAIDLLGIVCQLDVGSLGTDLQHRRRSAQFQILDEYHRITVAERSTVCVFDNSDRNVFILIDLSVPPVRAGALFHYFPLRSTSVRFADADLLESASATAFASVVCHADASYSPDLLQPIHFRESHVDGGFEVTENAPNELLVIRTA